MAEVFHTGLRIGKYELVRKLGEGGFGTLFVARDMAMDRDVAIKFLLPEHSHNQQVVQRFVREGRSLARVVHPGVVTVYETGEVSGTHSPADGSAYIIMELLAGETLTERLQRGRLTVSVAMELCRQLANALQAAHDQGIVHRDLKPDNIMLIQDPSLSAGERAKILDFGIAKLAKSESTVSAATKEGLVFGTPVYMSPEQAKSTASAGPSSDIYSLGCILFEMLVGQPPFAGSMIELITQHILSPPPVASEKAPGIPPHLDAVLSAMMAKTPEERPATMTVVETILEEKRAVASVARRRTLGGAQLATQAPPVSGPQIAPAGMAAAMAKLMAERPPSPEDIAAAPTLVNQQASPSALQAHPVPKNTPLVIPRQVAPMPGQAPSSQQYPAQSPSSQYPAQSPSSQYPVPNHTPSSLPAQAQVVLPAPRPADSGSRLVLLAVAIVVVLVLGVVVAVVLAP